MNKLCVISWLFIGAMSAAVANEPVDVKALLNLSLQDLLDLEVISVGKKPQTLQEIPAAVFIITENDIRHSGATTLPDLLRMVPGMNVGQINNHAWGISARGENDYFANKMLVMVDGRSVHVREFAGVWWDHLNLVLEDIDHIEVIRGPGGSLWGANAINGIINIISKNTKDTQGGLVTVAAGNQLNYITTARIGGEWSEQGHYRLYVKTRSEENPNFDHLDPGRNTQLGFRMDHLLSADDTLTVQGDYFRGRARSIDFSRYPLLADDETYYGANLMAHWTRQLEHGEWQLKGYYDTYQRDVIAVKTQTQIFNLEAQHRFQPTSNHDIVWGGSWRHYRHHADNTENFKFLPSRYKEHLFSAFMQDEITFNEAWHLTLGAKFEYRKSIGIQPQPSARILWAPTDKRSLWAALSRAVRLPDWGLERAEFKAFFPDEYTPFPFPSYIHLQLPAQALETEKLIAYELGWREVVNEQLFIDLDLFVHEYNDVLVPVNQAAVPQEDGLAFTSFYSNELEWDSHGAELAINWQPQHDLQVQAAYHYLHRNIPQDDLRTAPEHYLSLRTQWQWNPHWHFDTWWRYNSRVSGGDPTSGDTPMAEYVEFDARLAWQVDKRLELSLVGRNLLHKEHDEHRWASLTQIYLPSARSFYAQMRWTFE